MRYLSFAGESEKVGPFDPQKKWHLIIPSQSQCNSVFC